MGRKSSEDGKVTTDNPKKVDWIHLARAVWTLTSAFFGDPATRLRAWGLFLCTVFFTMLEVWAALKVSYQIKDMQNALNKKEVEQFWQSIKNLLLLICCFAPIIATHVWTGGALALEWRRSLTKKISDRYINSAQAFYRLKMQDPQVDNPDQRIAQDVEKFAGTSVLLLGHFIRDIGTIITSTVAVYYISPHTCYMMLAFTVVYSLIMLKGFASPLMRVHRRVLALEADFRYVLMRLRENAESIAFFQGAQVERELSEHFFLRTLRALYQKLCIETGYQTFQGIVQFLSFFAIYIPLAPHYFSGKLSYGSMTQAHMLLMHIEKSMSDFTRQLDAIAGLGAQAVRIRELWDTVDEYETKSRRRAREQDDDASTDAGSSDDEDMELNEKIRMQGDSEDEPEADVVQVVDLPGFKDERLIVDNVTLLPPEGESPLLHALSFTMHSADSVLISGPSGTGKSTLLRTIGGLFSRGGGRIQRTALSRSFFVPQSPYLYRGSLRENVMYPSSVQDFTDAERTRQDSQILHILQTLGIGYLVDRHGLDEDVEFDKMLSGGEKQRLNFARVFMRTDDLAFVLLDEATSALDEPNEDVAYGMLRESVTCYISVGHRMNLKKFHTKQLMLEKTLPGGGCSAMMLEL